MSEAVVVADIGNLRTKVAFCEHVGDKRRLLPSFGFEKTGDLAPWITDQPPAAWHLASVNRHRCLALIEWLSHHRPDDQVHVLQNSDIPIRALVDFPGQVGIDRLLAAWAATQLVPPGQPLITVDAGTAVTVDWIDKDHAFQGGTIFPGILACLRQLQEATAQLPLVELTHPPEFPLGRNTVAAIQSGVFHSQVGGIRYLVSLMEAEFGTCQVITTGGAMALMQGALPTEWRNVPDLVLQGIAKLITSRTEITQND